MSIVYLSFSFVIFSKFLRSYGKAILSLFIPFLHVIKIFGRDEIEEDHLEKEPI